ncbi:protein virilizer [Musca domestica]|uniref:Protein virilizer n=1 Tax=Musca domestica TaxID=7370 RepID=A0A1I8N3A7_MUSDO|nr:protein virilizer [Musca domestica]
MTDTEDVSELLFFDTFSHESDADINLDLVQFPKPVFITQVRIIPLGARVQADFPGGVRLGATNPSKFDIEFFVNDLGMPGASTFENLGQLQYNQNDCIHLECTQEKIPTDGLVLRGWYNTITLAVYGILTNSLTENIASPPAAPCEPEDMEELAPNLSGEARNTSLQDEEMKEEWKEPLPGELPVVTAHGHEREDIEYEGMRARGLSSSGEHYHRDSGEERTERRARKSSRSSERSPTSSRNRCHSESNDREYIRSRDRERETREREKNMRDWSRSPVYGHRSRRKRSERSRSDIEESHKWPRTPPATIVSPARPRSPDYSDEESSAAAHYKSSKPRNYNRRSSESLDAVAASNENPETTLPEEEETPGTPVEQYEPILSDDEILDDEPDDDSNTNDDQAQAADEFEQEIQLAAAQAKPAIIDFNPYTQPVQKLNESFVKKYDKDVEVFQTLLGKYEQQTKCDTLLTFKDASTGAEEKEAFVFLCEQFINQLSYISSDYKRRDYIFKELFGKQENLKLVYNILLVALDFEAACAQPQPAFKIRHIKTGARLMELLAPSATLFEYLLNTVNYDPFKAILLLYHQMYMALSIKLLLLKAIYALLDTKPALQYFLSPAVDGYQLILDLLHSSKLTRTKYFLQSIIKKLHLNEALATIRDTCTNLFVLTNYEPSSMEPFNILESAVLQVIDALHENCLSYQQPRRFLPVSKKFDISLDTSAQRSFANFLRSYFNHHTLAESLLLLLSNCDALPSSLVLASLDMLQALLSTHIGIDYLVDDGFEVTQMLVAILLGIDDVPSQDMEDVAEPEEEEGEDAEMKPLDGEAKSQPEEDVKKSPTESKEVTATDTTVPTSSTEITDPKSSNDPEAMELAENEEIQVMAQKHCKRSYEDQFIKLGIELSYKVQTRYHLDAIIFYSTVAEPYDAATLAGHLHAIYSQTCNADGRQYTVEVIGLNNQLHVFMDLIKQEQRLQAQRQLSSPGAKYKSPVLSYAVDMVDCCVRYCENLDYLIEFGKRILELAKNHETFEPSVSAVLQELFVYLKPIEVTNIFSYDDITPLVEVITRSMEYVTTFPGDLIMGLRILRHLAIGPFSRLYKSADTEELKHRYVALQFYAADGIQTLLQILEKLCAYFEQPGLHTPSLMTIQGIHCCQIILPTLQILREMLSFAIQCRDAEFKDLTAIDHLMRTYYLMHYFPSNSPAAAEVEKSKHEIIQTLLAYTQPNEQHEELLHKSLWTQMIREILKNIDSPSTFIPGLLVLAELLPLPLPVPLPQTEATSTGETLKTKAQRLLTERKLWSAHLHPQGAQIARLIEAMAPSSFPQLSDLLTRVCLQLADLAPNMTLLISKTFSDLLCNEWSTAGQQPTAQLSRLLVFYARLNVYPSLKISTLSILSGKLWDLFQQLLLIKNPSEIGIKCQISVHRLLESFLDTEISFIATKNVLANNNTNPLLNLASALPNKELIPKIADALFSNVMQADIKQGEVSALGIRNMIILTDHDITFYHLCAVLKQKKMEFQEWLTKLTDVNESITAYNPNVEALILFLRSLTQIEDLNQQYSYIPPRTLKLTAQELAMIIGFNREEKEKTIIDRLLVLLERGESTEVNVSLKSDLQQLKEMLTSCDVVLSSGNDEESVASGNELNNEPTLPQTESIVSQYDSRPVFTIYDALNGDDYQMTSDYWLQALNIDDLTAQDFETQYERVTCDLTELAQSCLTPECNLSSDCKRVLHLSASPQSNRERTPTAPCFRTRRVEVEPSTGRPEKKIFVTSMRGRGYARPPPSRGDLFRSRPPNTSRPPSLHVDDFLALETCGAQPTGPTGYNKIPPLMRGSRVGRNRGSRISAAAAYRKTKLIRTNSPLTWSESGPPSHYRSSDSHFGGGSSGEPHYVTSHFTGRIRGRGLRSRPYMR